MKFIVAGVGPGDPDLVTTGALKALRNADLVLSPHSRTERASVAESAVRAHIPDLKTVPVLFPMTSDAAARDAELNRQLEELRPLWQNAQTIVLPVIGDSTLYATGFYLYDLWKRLVPELELVLLPGISAHCLAAAQSKNFLAMGTEVLSIVPATAEISHIEKALAAADSVAMYKPCALRQQLRPVVEKAGPWARILRIDRAGLPDQKIYTGTDALEAPEEYLSILLLWRSA